MNADVFVDTNVLLYAVDTGDAAKHVAAQRWREALWSTGRGCISFQVLQEFYAKAMKIQPSAKADIRADARDLLAWRPIPISAELYLAAWRIEDRYRLSFWDALIVAASKAASCTYLLTEDLQHDQSFEGVRVISPFLIGPDAILN